MPDGRVIIELIDVPMGKTSGSRSTACRSAPRLTAGTAPTPRILIIR